MNEDLEKNLKWGVRKRLEFIEFRLFWYGRFNRADLVNTFGISAQQASGDISQYKIRWSKNLEYSDAQKAYLRTVSFDPDLIAHSTDRYLLQLVALESGWMQKSETWFEGLPKIESVALKRKPTNSMTLLAVLDAIRQKYQIEVFYCSMTGSTHSWRSIAPHALVENGGSWYVRAWSEQHNDFRDYKLNRINEVRGQEPSCIDYDLDYQWVQKINLEIIPNDKLPQAQQIAIADEYGMEAGVLSLPVRLSSAFYLMSQHNLDVEPGKLEPVKQQLVLRNKVDVEAATRLTRKMSTEALERSASDNC